MTSLSLKNQKFCRSKRRSHNDSVWGRTKGVRERDAISGSRGRGGNRSAEKIYTGRGMKEEDIGACREKKEVSVSMFSCQWLIMCIMRFFGSVKQQRGKRPIIHMSSPHVSKMPGRYNFLYGQVLFLAYSKLSVKSESSLRSTFEPEVALHSWFV